MSTPPPQNAPSPAAASSQRPRLLNLLASLDDVLQCVAGFLLAGVAVVLLYHSALVFGEMFSPTQYQDAVLRAIHDILLVMIVLELLWTVLAYLREHTVPLEPFLFVGIISSVRKLLLIGAQMSIEHQTPQVVDLQLREMLVHGGLIFVLIVGLVLVRWSRRWRLKDELRVSK